MQILVKTERQWPALMEVDPARGIQLRRLSRFLKQTRGPCLRRRAASLTPASCAPTTTWPPSATCSPPGSTRGGDRSCWATSCGPHASQAAVYPCCEYVPGQYVRAFNTTQHNTTRHDTTQHNTTQHNTTQHNTTQHNTTQHNTTQHNTTQHNTTRHDTTRHDTTRHDTTRHDTTRHDTTRHDTTGHDTTRHDTTRHDTTQHNTTQHNTTQHNTTQHNTTQHNTTQHNTTILPPRPGFDTVKHKLTLFCSQHVGREIGPLASLTPDDISDPATRNRLSCKGDDFYLTDVGMASSAAPSFWPPAHIFPVTLTDKDGLQQGGGGWNKPEGEGSGSTSTAVAGGGTARSPTRKAASPSNSATPLPTGSSAQPHAQTKAETNTQTQAQPRAEVQGRAQAQALAEIPFNAKAESCGRFMGEPPALQGGGSTCDVDVASSHFTPGTTGDLGAGASGTPNGDSSKAGVSASAVSVATSDQSTVTGSQPLQDRSLEGREGGGFGGGDPGAAPRDPEIVVALKPGGSGGSVAGGGVAKNGPMSVVTKSGLSVSTGAGNGFATSAGGQSRPALDGFRLTPAGLGEATDDGGSRGSSRRSSSREGRQAGTSTSSTSVATGADGREGEGSLFSPPTRTASFINGSHGNAPGPGPAGSTVEMAIPPVLANAAVLPAVVLPDLTVGGLEETAGAGGTGKDTAAGSQARKSRVALLLSRLKRGRNAAPANAKGDVKEAGAKGMAGKGSMTIIDGGVLVNNPSMVACVDLMDLRRRVAQEEGDPGLLRAPTALLSLGTGQEESSMLPYDKVKRWGLRKWLVPLLHIFLDGFSNLNEHYLQHLLCTWTKLLHPHRMQLQNLAR
eukprot:jgi/Mesvir1/14839/Mv05462-RA.2